MARRDPGSGISSLLGMGLAGVAVATSAQAADFTSEPRLVRIEDAVTVQDAEYVLPLTGDIAAGIIEDLGVVITLSGGADIGVLLEGESQLEWPVQDAPQTIRQTLTPLAESAFVGMTSNMLIEVAVTGTLFSQIFSYNLVSEPIEFTDRVEQFTPFLLPFQSDGPTELTLEPEPATGSLNVPLSLTGSGGIAGLTIAANVNVDPTSRAVIKGDSLDILVPQGEFSDTFSTDGSTQTMAGVFPSLVELYDQTDELDLDVLYNADIGVELGYEIGLTLTFGGNVFGNPININVPVGSFEIPLFPYIESPHSFGGSADTAPWTHPLPKVSIGTTQVAFVDVPGDIAATQGFPVSNQGKLDLEVEVAVEGSEQITAAPAELSVEPGGAASVIVTYTPDGPGSAQGVLVLKTSDPVRPEVRIPIEASAVEGGGSDLDDPGGFEDTPTDQFQTCGCDATRPGGGWLLLAGAGLLAMRRRRG